MLFFQTLKLEVLHFFIKTFGGQTVFQFEIIINVLASQLFLIHLNTYVIGLRPL